MTYGYRGIAERALGKPLPPGAVVHHLNGIHDDDRNTNLVICPDEAYHNLLHGRLEAFKACGNANWLKCYLCKEHDDPKFLLTVRKQGRRDTTFYHSSCRSDYRRAARALKRGNK